MNILFICRYNRFRSRIAEAFFNIYNTNFHNKAKSAGIIEGEHKLDKMQVEVAKEFGIRLEGKPRGLTSELLEWHDIAVIVADDVPKDLFKDDNKKYKKKVIIWKIHDPGTGDERDIGRTINEIEKRVRGFVDELR